MSFSNAEASGGPAILDARTRPIAHSLREIRLGGDLARRNDVPCLRCVHFVSGVSKPKWCSGGYPCLQCLNRTRTAKEARDICQYDQAYIRQHHSAVRPVYEERREVKRKRSDHA